MSFVERQIDLKGRQKVIKEINELKELLDEKGKEIDSLKKRIERLESKCGVGMELNERGNDEERGKIVREMVLLESDGDELYNLLLVQGENEGEIVKMTEDNLIRLCRNILDLDEGERLLVDNYEERGIRCERDGDGDWVVME